MGIHILHPAIQPSEQPHALPERMLTSSPFLQRLRHGSELEEADLAMLVGLCGTTREVAAKRHICHEGDQLDCFPIILSGWAAHYQILRDGSRQITGLLLPGDCFHHETGPAQAPEGIVALSRCTVAFVPHSELEDLKTRTNWVAQAFQRYGAFQRATLMSAIVNIGRRDALERMAYLICEVCQRLEAVGLGDGGKFHFPLTQEDLADVLSLTPVHTNRKLQQLRQEKYIDFRSKELKVLDRRGLESLAGFDPYYLYPFAKHQSVDLAFSG